MISSECVGVVYAEPEQKQILTRLAVASSSRSQPPLHRRDHHHHRSRAPHRDAHSGHPGLAHVADNLQHGHVRRRRHHGPPHHRLVRLCHEPEAQGGHLGGGKVAEERPLLEEGTAAAGRRREKTNERMRMMDDEKGTQIITRAVIRSPRSVGQRSAAPERAGVWVGPSLGIQRAQDSVALGKDVGEDRFAGVAAAVPAAGKERQRSRG